MAWQIACTSCDLLFTITKNCIVSADEPDGSILLLCPYCQTEAAYGPRDVLSAMQAIEDIKAVLDSTQPQSGLTGWRGAR